MVFCMTCGRLSLRTYILFDWSHLQLGALYVPISTIAWYHSPMFLSSHYIVNTAHSLCSHGHEGVHPHGPGQVQDGTSPPPVTLSRSNHP